MKARSEKTTSDAAHSFTPAGPFLLQRKCACGGSSGLSGQCEECDRKKMTLQRKGSASTATFAAPQIVHEVLHAPGHPLDVPTRTFMESRSGHDFSRVRVHSDSRAAESARAVGALAYTVGREVVFGAGKYHPAEPAGLRLLAHELVHVVQQQSMHSSAPGSASESAGLDRAATADVAPPSSAAEREADSLAETVASGRSVAGRISATTSGALHRSLRISAEDPNAERLRTALERLTGRTVGVTNGQVTLGDPVPDARGSRTVTGFIERAVNSTRTYRLRTGEARPDGSPVRGAAFDATGAEVVITVNTGHTGEFTWTIDELLAEQITSAVARSEAPTPPGGQSATTGATSTTGQTRAPMPSTDDEFLTFRLPYGSTDATPLADIPALQQAMSEMAVSARLTQIISRNLPNFEIQMRALGDIQSADGVTATEIIRGNETNTQYRIVQRIENGRVTIQYTDPRRQTVTEGRITGSGRRMVTFVPGATGRAAGAYPLPMTGTHCDPPEMNSGLGDSINSCCTDPMLDEINTHTQTARAHTQRAISRMSGGQRMDGALRRHFGSGGREARDAILTNLRQVSEEVEFSRHGWVCRQRNDAAHGCPPGRGGVTLVNEHVVRLCGWYGMDEFTEWTTVLHEIVHAAGVGTLPMGSEVYMGVSGSAYPPPTPQALLNADSYAEFARDVGGDAWQQEPESVQLPTLVPAIVGQVGIGSGPGEVNPVVGARFELTAAGPGLSVVDFTSGVTFLWLPQYGVVPPGSTIARDITDRYYLGAEAGARFNFTPSRTFFFDLTGGAGALWPGAGADVAFAPSARATLGLHYGTPSAGFAAGIDFRGILDTADTSRSSVFVGVGAGAYFGGPSEEERRQQEERRRREEQERRSER